MRGRAKASAQRDEPVAPASPDECHRRATDGDTLVPAAEVEGLDFADDVGTEITPLQRRAESHPAVEDDVIEVFVVHDSAPIHEGKGRARLGRARLLVYMSRSTPLPR